MDARLLPTDLNYDTYYIYNTNSKLSIIAFYDKNTDEWTSKYWTFNSKTAALWGWVIQCPVPTIHDIENWKTIEHNMEILCKKIETAHQKLQEYYQNIIGKETKHDN